MNYTKHFMKLSIWGKLLIIIILLMIGVSFFSVKKEGFKSNKKFVFNDSVYDNFWNINSMAQSKEGDKIFVYDLRYNKETKERALVKLRLN
jgi:uncharacterized protein YxeA